MTFYAVRSGSGTTQRRTDAKQVRTILVRDPEDDEVGAGHARRQKQAVLGAQILWIIKKHKRANLLDMGLRGVEVDFGAPIWNLWPGVRWSEKSENNGDMGPFESEQQRRRLPFVRRSSGKNEELKPVMRYQCSSESMPLLVLDASELGSVVVAYKTLIELPVGGSQ